MPPLGRVSMIRGIRRLLADDQIRTAKRELGYENEGCTLASLFALEFFDRTA